MQIIFFSEFWEKKGILFPEKQMNLHWSKNFRLADSWLLMIAFLVLLYSFMQITDSAAVAALVMDLLTSSWILCKLISLTSGDDF